MASSVLQMLPKDFGYVILVALASCFLNIYYSFKVGAARKKYGVKYPKMYTEDKDKQEFNCIQRVHQNFVETWAQVLMLLFISGLQHPCFTTVVGSVQLLGRIFYAWGYYTGEPSKREPGAIVLNLANLLLLGGAVSCALHVLRYL